MIVTFVRLGSCALMAALLAMVGVGCGSSPGGALWDAGGAAGSAGTAPMTGAGGDGTGGAAAIGGGGSGSGAVDGGPSPGAPGNPVALPPMGVNPANQVNPSPLAGEQRLDFAALRARGEMLRAIMRERQQSLLEQRYDLADRPSASR